MPAPDDAGTPLVPQAFRTDLLDNNGSAAASWLARLPAFVAEACERWSVAVDGPSMHGAAGLVVPVRSSGGALAVLKVSWPHEEAAHEADALRRWDGVGAVRLLAEHTDSWSLLLERLDSETSLEEIPDADAAVQTAAEVLPQLHVSPPPVVPSVADLAARWLDELPAEHEALGRPVSRQLLTHTLATCREAERQTSDRLLHGDYHYANVLAGERQPWLAIDPKPMAGPPEFDVAPLLRNRWSDLVLTGDLAGALRRRFDHIVDVADLDRDSARAWAVARTVDNVLWATAHRDASLAAQERTIAETFA